MTRTLVRGAVTAALTVALAAGVGAGTASAAPAAPTAPTAAQGLSSYCNALSKLHDRFPRLAERLPRRFIEPCAGRSSGGSDNSVVILPGSGSSPGSGFEGGLLQ